MVLSRQSYDSQQCHKIMMDLMMTGGGRFALPLRSRSNGANSRENSEFSEIRPRGDIFTCEFSLRIRNSRENSDGQKRGI
jgi:hypothetical protein